MREGGGQTLTTRRRLQTSNRPGGDKAIQPGEVTHGAGVPMPVAAMLPTYWPQTSEPSLLVVLTGLAVGMSPAALQLALPCLQGFAVWDADHVMVPTTHEVTVLRSRHHLTLTVSGRQWAQCPIPDDPNWRAALTCLLGIGVGKAAPRLRGEDLAVCLAAELQHGRILTAEASFVTGTPGREAVGPGAD